MTTPPPPACPFCQETILTGEETGPPIHYMTTEGITQHRAHIECGFRAVHGGWGHHEDHAFWCGVMGDPDAGLNYRESARLVYEHWRP